MLTLKLAWRNLFRNTRRTVLTVALIAFSLTAMILTDAIIKGMVNVMVDSVTHTLAGEAQVDRKGFRDAWDTDLMLDHSSQLEQEIASSPAVAGYAPRVIAGAMVSSSYNVASGVLYGVDPDKELKVSRIRDAVIRGQYLSGKPGEILLGSDMADLLEVKLGDRIVITSAQPGSGELAQALYRVSGILHFGSREYDNRFVFVNLPQARTMLGMTDQSQQIAIRFKDPEDARNPALPLFKKLNQGNIEAVSWLEANPEVASILGMTGFSSLIVGLILFLLASLGVINSMFMSIYERIYEIGVIKAIGTKPADLMRLVLAEATLIALISCVFGLALGYGLGTWFSTHGVPMGDYELSGVVLSDNIMTVLAPYQFIDFPVYVILLTVIAAIYPAWFAARLVPAEALQRSL